MVEHQFETGTDDVEFGASSATDYQRSLSDTGDRRSLSDEQWMVYNCLRDRSRPIDLSALARELVEKRRRTWNRKVLSDGMDNEGAEQIGIRLHHVLLPSLEELGVLEYDESHREAAPPDGSGRF